MSQGLWTFVALAALAGGYHALFGRSHLAAIATQHQRVEADYARRQAAEQQAERTERLQQCADALARWRAELAGKMAPRDPGTPPLVVTTRTLEQDRLVVERSEALPADATLALPHDRVRVAVSGRFADLFRAVLRMENSWPPARVVDLSLQSDAAGATVRGELTVVLMRGQPR